MAWVCHPSMNQISINTITGLFHSLKYRYTHITMPKNTLLWGAELVSMVGGTEQAMVGGQETNCKLGLHNLMSLCFILQCVWDIVERWLHHSRSGHMKMLWSAYRNVRIWAVFYGPILAWWWITPCILLMAHCNVLTMLARNIYNESVASEVLSCSFGLWEVKPSLIY